MRDEQGRREENVLLRALELDDMTIVEIGQLLHGHDVTADDGICERCRRDALLVIGQLEWRGEVERYGWRSRRVRLARRQGDAVRVAA